MNLKVRLEPTDRSDLMCVYCGGFNTQFAVQPGTPAQAEPQVGVHKKCIPFMKPSRGA